MNKLKNFELTFKKENNKWSYNTFVRTTQMSIKEQKDFFYNILTDEVLEVVEKKVNESLYGNNEEGLAIVKFALVDDDAYEIVAIGVINKKEGE